MAAAHPQLRQQLVKPGTSLGDWVQLIHVAYTKAINSCLHNRLLSALEWVQIECANHLGSICCHKNVHKYDKMMQVAYENGNYMKLE